MARHTTQPGRSLCGTMAAAELNNPVLLMHASGVAHISSKDDSTVTNRTEKYEGLVQNKNFTKGVVRFGRFNKHGLIRDLPQTLEICTFYEDKLQTSAYV